MEKEISKVIAVFTDGTHKEIKKRRGNWVRA